MLPKANALAGCGASLYTPKQASLKVGTTNSLIRWARPPSRRPSASGLHFATVLSDCKGPLSPSRVNTGGEIPRAVKDSLRREERFPPSFRARKASLVQPGKPPAPPVLDCTPPWPFGLSPPFRRKTLFAFRVRGDSSTQDFRVMASSIDSRFTRCRHYMPCACAGNASQDCGES